MPARSRVHGIHGAHVASSVIAEMVAQNGAMRGPSARKTVVGNGQAIRRTRLQEKSELKARNAPHESTTVEPICLEDRMHIMALVV